MTISPSSTKAPPLERRNSALKGEIVEIWSQVQVRVIQLAGDDPSKIKKDLTIEGVLVYLDKAQDQSAPKDSSIRGAFEKTLRFIDTVGGVIAVGVSEAFGPSELCFNALSMVIQAWQGYQGVFESLATLLEKCGQYMSRLEYYIRAGMDAKLAKVACQHLQLFVEICDRTIKLRRSTRRRIKVFTKLLFLNDNDIEDLLTKMDGLVDEEGRLVAAQTFSFASETVVSTRENLAISRAVNSKLDMLIANRSDSLKESDTKRRKERILETLAFDENKLDQDKREPDPYWQRIYYNYRKCVVPGTGEWVFQEPEFRAWERGSRESPCILAIEGTEGSGKSYLTSTIIRRLRNRSSVESSDSRTLLAFYFVEGDSKEELKRTNHLDVIAKSLIWQFVQADVSYMKSVANICEQARDMDPHEVPGRLLFDNGDIGQTIDANFFIVIDGLNDIVGDTLVTFLENALSSSVSHRKIRILLTGRPRAFEQISAHKEIAYKTIHISERNRPDIEMYIESRMDKIDALRNKQRFGVPALRKKISESLRDKTAGDYFRVNTILKRINNLDYVNDIDQVLENAGRERSQQIQAEIESLNSTRNAKEIAEINEIILWILYGREWFQPQQMAAVLYTKTGELSLLTLEAKLQIKYTIFEVDSDGDIDFRSYEIVELIPEGNQPSGEDLRQASKRVLPEEVDIVRHFLRTVCPPQLYTKFDFETVFEQKLRHTGGYIYRDDKDTAEAKLAVRCLRILTEERDERREILRLYAVNYFHQHLAAVDLSLVGRQWKRQIGPLLLKLFTDDGSTDALLWTSDPDLASNFAWMVRSAWLDGNGGATETVRWLRESVAVVDITDDEARSWVSNFTSSLSPDKELLNILAKRMVVRWLREQTPQSLAVYAFSFILGALKKINGVVKVKTPGSNPDVPTVEDISEIEEWSRQLLGCEKDSLWEVQVAVILHNFQFDADAEKRCRRSLQLDPSNWRASYYLAHVVPSNGEAIEILNDIIGTLEADQKWMEESNHVWAFAEMLFDRGQRFWDAEQFPQAIESYTKSVQVNYAGFKRILQIIEQYYGRRLWTDILSLLRTIQAGSGDKAHLSKMLVDLASEERFHSIVLQTAVETGQFEFIEQVYNDAIKLSTESEAYTSLYYIRYHYANEMFQQDNGEERAIELWETALKDDLPRSFLDIDYVLPYLTVKLAPVYLSRALEAEEGSETAQDYLHRISSITPDETSESNVILPSKLYLARYYQVEGDEAKAKQIVRSIVKLALEMLSDDDNDNDYLAYWRLLLVFLPLNDDQNALAAVSMAALASQSTIASAISRVPRLEEPKRDSPKGQGGKDHSKKERKEQSPRPRSSSLQTGAPAELRRPSTPNTPPTKTPDLKPVDPANLDDPTAPVFAICDGGCGDYWEAASEMWWCKDCINLTFDKDCFQQLRDGTLPLKVCDKDHEFLEVPKWDGAVLKDAPRNSVPFAGKVISLEEWKKAIVRKYIE
ncbi:Putative NACHT and TPR domain protein (AFU_orthologue; AFUA_7G06670) [Aspergillus calidoustus]|uniref:Putative NACHT and TPR domain protein (AFU_orthologue AFUA_7G06670) n=1 Tax=Aspergillus calidoustus TaxID=454130 RepID=A0A0U5FTX0_ASPCI|nr:Putative NACHT and TPR domain protein (AFU_orthologue; AFUA_7G06670) [Aspergillus calidoustus]